MNFLYIVLNPIDLPSLFSFVETRKYIDGLTLSILLILKRQQWSLHTKECTVALYILNTGCTGYYQKMFMQ